MPDQGQPPRLVRPPFPSQLYASPASEVLAYVADSNATVMKPTAPQLKQAALLTYFTRGWLLHDVAAGYLI